MDLFPCCFVFEGWEKYSFHEKGDFFFQFWFEVLVREMKPIKSEELSYELGSMHKTVLAKLRTTAVGKRQLFWRAIVSMALGHKSLSHNGSTFRPVQSLNNIVQSVSYTAMLEILSQTTWWFLIVICSSAWAGSVAQQKISHRYLHLTKWNLSIIKMYCLLCLREAERSKASIYTIQKNELVQVRI